MIPYFYLLMKIVFIINLIYLSVIDVKTKLVPVKGQAIALLSGCVCFGLSFLFTKFSVEKGKEGGAVEALFYKIVDTPGSLLSGFFVLLIICSLIALLSGGLGGGDVKIFSAAGLICGLKGGVEILLYALALSGIFCVILRLLPLVFKRLYKLKKVKEIPLLPFITISSVLQFLQKTLYY